MAGNIYINQVRTNERFNFKSIYALGDYSGDYPDFPFGVDNSDCDYYEPQQFYNLIDGVKKLKSYFHLTC